MSILAARFVQRFIPICLVVLPLSSSPAVGLEEKGRGADSAIVSRIDSLLAEPGLKGGFQGIIIQSLEDGRVWYERNPDMMFLPASNQKLLTSAAILNALGPDWRYTTRVLRHGDVDSDGVLHGDLYLIGSGDPLLSARDLDELTESVKAAGIRRIEGRVIGDESRFDSQRYAAGWAWDDMSYYYSAEVSALNLDENVVRLTFDPGKGAGDPVRLSPSRTYVKIVNRARTVKAVEKTALRIERDLGMNRVTIDGTLAADARPEDHRPVPVTVENPALFAATTYADRLKAAGIEVTDSPALGKTEPDSIEVARHESPPMSEILAKLNKPSDNLVAECLMKTLGAERGKGGTWAAGREVATAWFKEIGMDPNGIDMTDGSGLSRQTFVTPRNLAILLRTMYSHPHGKVYLDSLPIAGVDGTLRNRMKGTAAEKNCQAKSGYVSSVSSLSGYVTTKSGEPLLFVMLMNNHKARNAIATGVQDRIVALFASLQ